MWSIVAVVFLLFAAFAGWSWFRYQLKMIYFVLCIIVGGIVGGCASLPFGKSTENHFRIFRIFQFLCRPLGIKYELRHTEFMESSEPYVLIANHQSCLDVLSMSYCWPKNCVVMLKSSLKFLPGFNICAYICDSIYINRFSKDSAHKTVDNTLSDIVSNKRKVWIYPEGTRSAEKKLLPFKKGAFIIAKQAKIRVVCCVFTSYRNFYDSATRRFDDNGEVIAEFLPSIDSNDFETVDDLLEHCREKMQNAHDRLNVEMAARTGDKKSQ